VHQLARARQYKRRHFLLDISTRMKGKFWMVLKFVYKEKNKIEEIQHRRKGSYKHLYSPKDLTLN
jgi:hypothetical protein